MKPASCGQPGRGARITTPIAELMTMANAGTRKRFRLMKNDGNSLSSAIE
jgi:hypothetical protein